ncbi:Hypoxia-responsive family protein-like [Rhynchospora pubera]|uniref:Hypoxia-responsive family protein-like n=1 Tax=Rhynchospora pubera TaxID=906938 RepID=A0AAV8GP14_9POAL|nr:Hypoxia-responsive family protein-like [Rhynchospora pubera]
MAEAPSKIESIRKWVVEHKLRTVGCLWLSGISGSIAYNWSQPNMKTSVKIIHARFVFLFLLFTIVKGNSVIQCWYRLGII